jgi:hypothetical protein
MKPFHHLHTTVSSTYGTQRLIHLRSDFENQTFDKPVNHQKHHTKYQNRISHSIPYSVVSSSLWILPLQVSVE